MDFDCTDDQQCRHDQVREEAPFATQAKIVRTARATAARHNARDGTRVRDGNDFHTENLFARQYGDAKILEIGG